MFIWPDASLAEMISALELDAALFPAGFTLRLYTNDFTPTRTSVVGDFTQLTNVEVPGYAAATPAWNGVPFRRQDGSWEDWSDQNQFIAAGGPPPSPVVVYGWYITNAGNTVVYAGGRFTSPFTFVQDGDGFSLKMRMNVNQVGDDTVEIITDTVME